MTKHNSKPDHHDTEKDINSSSLIKKLKPKQVLGQTLKHAKDAVDLASDAALQVMDAATFGTARKAASMTSDAFRDVVSGTTETAREVALAMARTFLGRSTLTLPLPEMVLNKQIRKKIETSSDISELTIECGQDRLNITIGGFYKKLIYTLKLDFNVLECKIGQEKFLRLRQVSESLKIQIRDANLLTNWAVGKVSHKAFDLVNRLPIPSLINHIIRDIPGIQQQEYRLWYIDLDKAGIMDFLDNRSWMVDRMISLTDFSVLPGLNILRESRELMQQLVDQFEVRGLRVQPGRLEIQVGIARNE